MRPAFARLHPVVRACLFGLVVALLASMPISSVQASITRPFSASSIIQLADGIRYQQGTMRTTSGIQSVRVATVDPSHPRVRLRALLSNDRVVNRELPSRLARRKSGPAMRAMVATNGDMSTRQRLDAYAAPQGLHVQGGELMVMQACARPTLGIDAAGQARIGLIRVHMTIDPPNGAARQVHRVNTHRDDTHVVLFTRRFASSTRTDPGGVEVVLDLPHTLRPNDVQRLTVLRVRRGGGDTGLREGQAVLSVKSTKSDWVKHLRVGQRLELRTQVVRKVDRPCGGTIAAAPDWADIVEAIGGNHFTARNGDVAAPSRSVYPAGSRAHPRTNVGVMPDGRVLMVTIDGRQPGYSIGVTLAEAGRLMLSLGARHAFNMDGGGSTMMGRRLLASGEFVVANRPSDGRERLATQALSAFEVTPD
jgi:large repetitive protein